ncbi:MAG: hypothetical protein WKF79_00155 [Nocardioides sp.]
MRGSDLNQIVKRTNPSLARIHRNLAKAAPEDGQRAGHLRFAMAYEGNHSLQPPEDAQPGDPCALLIATGADGQAAICDGTLDPYVDVWGVPNDCACHISPPCHACLSAPLACATCLETVP